LMSFLQKKQQCLVFNSIFIGSILEYPIARYLSLNFCD
jgi:hypothetical protein